MPVDIQAAKHEIQTLVNKYDRVKTEGRISKFNEENTKAEFIEPLFEALGWDVRNKHHPDEVTREEKISKDRVDYSFRINGIPKFFLEAKALRENLDNPEFTKQAINYSWHKGCTWAVLTDFEEVKIFNAEWRTADYNQNRVKFIRYHEFLDKFDELWLLSRESFEKGLLDKEAEKWGKKTKKSPVDKQLLADFTHFREILSKNITKLNQGKKLTQEELDEATQRILDRLMFIKFCEDKELEERKLIANLREWESRGKGQLVRGIREVYSYFDKLYNSKIFAKHLCDDLEIDNEVLYEIIEGLHFTKDRSISYDFSAIEADVLGNIYEQYLGHILKKTAKTAKLTESQAHRKEQGIYYTPTYIVDYIVRNTLGKMLEDKKVKPDKIRVLDMACGSGSFLIKAFDVLNEYHTIHDKNYAQTTLDLTVENGTYTKKLRILEKNIFGVDLDRQAVEVAQLNLLLKIAEKGRRLPLLQQNIKQGNSLIDNSLSTEDRIFKWETEFEPIMREGGFDVIIGNPPYIRIQTLDKNQLDYFSSNFKSATKNYDIYALFVERGFSLLKEGGVLGFILPSKFFNSDYGAGLRRLLAEKECIYKIVNFKDYQVFDNAITYTCLLFLTKSHNKSIEYLELSDSEALKQTKVLIDKMFKVSKQEQPDEDEWNFVSNDSKDLMKKLDKIGLRLGDISSELFVGLQTSADRLYFVYLVEDNGKHAIVRNNFDKKEHVIEKEILKKLLKGKEIKRWQTRWQGIYVVYPYLLKDKSAKLIPLHDIRRIYPKAYKYFETYEKELKARENNSFAKETDWHKFGRLQNIEKFEQPKIMTQVLSSRNTFTFDKRGEFYFVGGGNAGGYGITLKEEYADKYHLILSLLNSKVLEFYLKKISTPFQGGFYSYGKRFIERLPILIPDRNYAEKLADLSRTQLEMGKRLNEIGEKMTDARAEIMSQLERNDAEINAMVYKLYGITEDEKKIIEESIK